MDGFGHGRSQPPPSPVSFVTSGDPEGLSSGGATVAPYYAPARSGFFLSFEDSHHFLDSCFLCKKPLTGNCDIFMYRGDMPFCSEVCRQEQIEIDEAEEKKKTTTLKHQLSINDEQRSSPPKSQKIEVKSTGTVVAG